MMCVDVQGEFSKGGSREEGGEECVGRFVFVSYTSMYVSKGMQNDDG